MRGGVNVNS